MDMTELGSFEGLLGLALPGDSQDPSLDSIEYRIFIDRYTYIYSILYIIYSYI